MIWQLCSSVNYMEFTHILFRLNNIIWHASTLRNVNSLIPGQMTIMSSMIRHKNRYFEVSHIEGATFQVGILINTLYFLLYYCLWSWISMTNFRINDKICVQPLCRTPSTRYLLFFKYEVYQFSILVLFQQVFREWWYCETHIHFYSHY